MINFRYRRDIQIEMYKDLLGIQICNLGQSSRLNIDLNII